MGELTSATLFGVENSAKDVLAACASVREGSAGAQSILGAARSVYLGALELADMNSAWRHCATKWRRRGSGFDGGKYVKIRR